MIAALVVLSALLTVAVAVWLAFGPLAAVAVVLGAVLASAVILRVTA